ncbi:hypothetical protein PLESTB_001743300 [Pleodorina starrii]|uniref:Nucleolar protein 14 n=1 Tax=Pleodorina starrii TaxID=330485 RepID=A0A9W6FA18_9CHLO|nr:hypothetical protein PLESTM_001676100 [Pleodorina starrii]GLC61320.1 hypothetical protein PLESTB_001743300 [Pleodorina starrii]
MAKAKPKAAAAKAKTAVLAAQMKAKPKKPNPFELKGSKGHFDTIGRRLSGKKQNVIQARQEAVNRRKKTLLVEYRQLRKANTFVDRRFGETDPELTEADKGLARLQAQRLKQQQQQDRLKKKRGSKFTLSEGDDGGEGLTHLGRSLSDADLRNLMDRPEFDDLDEEMVEELVAQYHFGGGGGGEGGEGEGEEGAAARGPDGKPKTRKQVMEEIIAKSRMYRALKAKQREEDEAALEAINQEFRQLVASATLNRLIKAPGENKGVKVKADNPDDAAYDIAARELAFESKGAAGERTLSPEELQERERQRLEKLEKERLKRMRGGGDDEDEDDEGEEEGESGDDGEGRRGGKRRREMQSGDALGDDYDSEGSEGDDDDNEGAEEDEGEEGDGGGISELDQRRMKAAAGNHPLQETFRAAAAALAKKYGVEAPVNPFLEEGEEEDEDEEGEEEEGESGSGDGEEEEEEGEDDDNDEEEEVSEEEQLEQRRNPAHPPSTSRPGDGEGNAAAAAAGKKKAPAAAAAVAVAAKAGKPLEGPLDLPYTIPLPSSYNEFAALVNGRPAEDLATAIGRIRAFNAVALATDNKRKMQELYGILVQHFALEAGKSPLPVPSLDVLTRVLLELTPEVPYYAATVARARLGRMSEQLTAALGGATSSPWPPARVVLQLKLFSALFPTSDRRHPVLTPAALLVGKYLNQCVVSNPHEAALGLCLCGLMTHLAAPAQRTTPEVLVFLRDCLAALLPAGLAACSSLPGPGAGAAAGQKGKEAGAKKRRGGGGAGAAENGSGGEAAAAVAPPAPQQQQQQRDPDAFVRFAPGCLALGGNAAAELPPPPPALDLYGVLGMSSSDPRVGGEAFKLGLLRVALCGVRRAAAVAAESGLVCFEQLFGPLRSVVSELSRIDGRLPEELRNLRASVQQQLVAASATCVASRRPLAHPGRARSGGAAAGVIPAAAVREFNPRFEDGFVSGRDYDPDRQRAEARRLKRALVKERRGAIRELRRDSVFMAEERDRETARVDAERLQSERQFYSELQRQEADLRSGGQGGMNPHLKKRKGGGGKR